MPDLTSTAPTPAAAAGEGTVPAGRSSDQAPEGTVAPAAPSGQPAAPTPPPAESPQPAGDSLPGWKSLDDATRDYKALQAAYTKARQALSGLGDPTTLRQQQQFVEHLLQDPDFLAWSEQRLAKETAGSADPQTVEAMRIVRQLAHEEASRMVAPLQAQAVENKLKTVFGQMTERHGKAWEQHKSAMRELHQADIRRGLVSPRAEVDFDLAYVEGLYARAIAGDEEFAAKAYADRLARKRSASTISAPGTAPAAIGPSKARSLEEAFQQARRQHGLA